MPPYILPPSSPPHSHIPRALKNFLPSVQISDPIMSNNNRKSTGDRRNPSRLQRRAPASIEINRVTDWNVAIPLLSPLITSPASPDAGNLKSAINRLSNSKEEVKKEVTEKPSMVFKKWQHPAAPFCHEPAPLIQFVCTGTADRRLNS